MPEPVAEQARNSLSKNSLRNAVLKGITTMGSSNSRLLANSFGLEVRRYRNMRWWAIQNWPITKKLTRKPMNLGMTPSR